jgi:hypothetical protein
VLSLKGSENFLLSPEIGQTGKELQHITEVHKPPLNGGGECLLKFNELKEFYSLCFVSCILVNEFLVNIFKASYDQY